LAHSSFPSGAFEHHGQEELAAGLAVEVGLYVPAAQATHSLEVEVRILMPVNPATQMQSSPPSEPAGLLALVSHAIHDAVPEEALNVEGGQRVQEPDSVSKPLSKPVNPGLHKQSPPKSEPAALLEFESQGTQSVTLVWADTPLNVPAVQFVQAAVPVSPLYVPALQA
jgi:hypothetical protein